MIYEFLTLAQALTLTLVLALALALKIACSSACFSPSPYLIQWNLSIKDTPNKGHCIKYLSTMDKTKSPNFIPPINIMRLESLNRGQSLYNGQTT